MACELCGGVNGCRPTRYKLTAHGLLTRDDWAEIYQFMRYVYLPFIHRIVARARMRSRNREGG